MMVSCESETLLLMFKRWKKLEEDFLMSNEFEDEE